jgi:probable phosphoglycerate mutase
MSLPVTEASHHRAGPGSGETVTRLVLIRHGESNATVARTIGGPRTCSGLSPLGRKQAEALAERVARTGELAGAALVSSQYPRAIETAEIVARGLGDVEVTVDPEVGEHDPGPECDGLSFDTFVARYGRPDWDGDPDAEWFPGGETLAQFHRRIESALRRLVAEHEDGTVAVVCHGGVVDAAFRHLLGLPATGSFDLWTLNTSLTELVRPRGGRWRLVRYNDAAHLAGLTPEALRS